MYRVQVKAFVVFCQQKVVNSTTETSAEKH